MTYVSVDGGATKTIAVCYDSDGKVLGMAANGPSNFRNVGIENAGNHITSAVRNSIERAGMKFNEIEKITFALAGVKDSRKSTDIIDNFIRKLEFNAPYTLLNDGEAGYNSRFFEDTGIIAAPGTGMIAFGKINGVFERTSGWGWLIGDEGGAFYIGRRAIQESAKTADGRNDVSPVLLDRVMEFFGVNEPRHLVNEVYTNPINIRRIAMLAREVSRLSGGGDELSSSILREAAREAARCVIGLKRAYNVPELPVSGYGGVFRSGAIYWDTLKETVSFAYEETEYLDPLYGYHAVLGSMYLVLRDSGVNEINTGKILEDFNVNIEKLPEKEKKDYLLM